MKQGKVQITFEANAKRPILGIFGKKTDAENYVVESNAPTQRVLTPSGEEVKVKRFAGIRKGSNIFITSDIDSLIDAADHIE